MIFYFGYITFVTLEDVSEDQQSSCSEMEKLQHEEGG